ALRGIPKLDSQELCQTNELKKYLKEHNLVSKRISEFFIINSPLDKFLKKNIT
ncbi:unnamed protein product, partial [marine sediment metagenome]